MNELTVFLLIELRRMLPFIFDVDLLDEELDALGFFSEPDDRWLSSLGGTLEPRVAGSRSVISGRVCFTNLLCAK